MNTLLLFIATNSASVFLGWVFGRTGRNAAVVAAAVEDQETSMEEARATRPFRMMAIATMVICGVTAATGVVVASNQNSIVEDHRTFAECVSDQFDLLIEALDARTVANREATLQQDRIWVTVAEAFRNPGPEASQNLRTVIEEYNKIRAETTEKLRQNPYPDPPRDACRE